MKPMIRALAVLAVTTAVSVPAAAQFAKAEDAINYRQSAFALLGHHFGRLGAMASGKMPYDAAVAASDGEIIALVSKLPITGLVPGSEKGHDTRAKPELWKEMPKVKELYQDMTTEVQKVSVAAKSGSLDQLKAAFGPAAQSCKACHDNYRAK